MTGALGAISGGKARDREDRMPDHPSLLQTYVWQNYDLFPKFPAD
jgi:uncharacterized protein Usg